MTAAVQVGPIAPEINVNGSPMSATILARLASLKIDLALNTTGRAQFRFDDPNYVVGSDASLAFGTEITVSSGTTVLFAGEVTGVEVEQRRGATDFVVTVDDKSYKLGLGTSVASFTQVKASDVVSTLCNSYGLRASTEATSIQMPYLIHAGSDLELLNQLAERVGYDWWVDDQTLNFKSPAAGTAVSLTFGEDLVDFSVRASALHPGATTVTGWRPATKQGVTSTSAQSAVALKPDATLVTGFVSAQSVQNQSKVTTAVHNPADQSDAQGVSDSLAQRWVSQAVTARGTTMVSPSIVIGGSVTVQNAGPASGTYHVTAVQHVYSHAGFVTRFTAGDRRPSGLVDSLGGAGRTTGRTGLQVGVVTALGSGEFLGMVKLKFPAIIDSVESNWARVATIGGGAQRGMTFLPEVNDEVLVGFEAGDFSHPVVIGGLYNGRDTAVEFGAVNGKVDRRRITSRLGHFMEFGDGAQPADQLIGLTLAGAQHSVILGKQKLSATVPSGVPVEIKAGNSLITINDAGNITLQGQKIVVKAAQDLELSGMNVTIKGSVKVEASATQVSVKGSATAELSSGGQTSVKGAMVAIN